MRRFSTAPMAVAVLLCFASALVGVIPLRKCAACDSRSKAFYAKQNSTCSRVRVPWTECYRQWDREQGSACRLCRGSHRVSLLQEALSCEP